MSYLKSGFRKSKKETTFKKSKKSSFLLELEKKYGLKISNQIIICEDRFNITNGLPDSLIFKWGCIPPKDCIERSVGYLNITENEINSLDDIYKLSNSGFNSSKHSINQNWEKIKKENLSKGISLLEIQMTHFKTLIPVILIEMKGKTISFRVDNPYIREMFYVTENILNYYKDYSEIDKKEVIIRDKKMFEEHVQYLKKIFDV